MFYFICIYEHNCVTNNVSYIARSYRPIFYFFVLLLDIFIVGLIVTLFFLVCLDGRDLYHGSFIK